MSRQPWEPDHELAPDEARERLRSAFPELRIGDVRYLAEGWDFRVFEVDGEWLFRFPKRRQEAQRLATEVALLRKIADLLPVPVPRYEFHAQGIGGYRRLGGRPLSAIVDSTGCAADFAAFLTALHGIPVEGLGLPERGDSATPARGHERLARRLAKVEHALEPDVLAACRAVVEAPPPPMSSCPAVVTHDDLFPEHVLVSADGERITGVLDWGDAALGDPAIDFFLPAFCGGEPFLREVLARYEREPDAGLVDRALDIARCVAGAHVVDGVRMKRPDYLAEGRAALGRLGIIPGSASSSRA